MTNDPLSLIEAWLDGDLDAAGQRQLDAWLREDPDHLRIFARETHLHRQLHDMLRRRAYTLPAEEGKDALPPVSGQSPVLGFLSGILHAGGDTPGVTAFMWLVMASLTGMTLMAVLLVVLTIRGVHVTVEPPQESRQQAAGSGQKGEGEQKAEGGRRKGEGEPEPEAVPAVAVARLSRMADCRWTLGEDEQEPAAGDDLTEGQVLRLKSGLAEILFRSGAKTLLQGPARLELLSRNSAQLHRGTLTARVEVASAKGFTVHTPAMKLVDLGTEFGVLVKRDGAEEVHVFRGTVRAEAVAEGGRGKAEGGRGKAEGSPISPRPLAGEGSGVRAVGAPLVLSANQALRFDAEQKTVVRQAAAPERFARHMPGPEPFPIFSTGMGLSPGQPDPHWQIVTDSTNPNFRPRPAVACELRGDNTPNVPEVSQWLSIANPLPRVAAGCRWTLRTEFDLTGFDPSTARIDGAFAADNYLAELRLNGKPLPLPEGARAEDSYRKKSPLRINGGFVAGRNTLEVVVENGDRRASLMGLNLELHGTAVRKAETKGK